MDIAGNVTAEQRYPPFGSTRYTSGITPTDYRYTGQREEDTLGLYDYKARWYDPVLGRFLQPGTLVPDPGNPMAYDRYAYVFNNPMRYTDPSGYKPLDPEFHMIDGVCGSVSGCNSIIKEIDDKTIPTSINTHVCTPSLPWGNPYWEEDAVNWGAYVGEISVNSFASRSPSIPTNNSFSAPVPPALKAIELIGLVNDLLGPYSPISVDTITAQVYFNEYSNSLINFPGISVENNSVYGILIRELSITSMEYSGFSWKMDEWATNSFDKPYVGAKSIGHFELNNSNTWNINRIINIQITLRVYDDYGRLSRNIHMYNPIYP